MPKVIALEDHGRHKAGDEYYCTASVLDERIAAAVVERPKKARKPKKPKKTKQETTGSDDRDDTIEG